MDVSAIPVEANFTGDIGVSWALPVAIKSDSYVLLPLLCLIALASDSLVIATLCNMDVKRSSVLLMILVAFTDIAQFIGLIGFVEFVERNVQRCFWVFVKKDW